MKVLLADVLARLSHELRTLAHASAALEAAVQDALLAKDASNQSVDLHNIQHLDLLTQTLADIARFTEKIAMQATDSVVDLDDALAVLQLRDLRQGLAGKRVKNAINAGHVDVF